MFRTLLMSITGLWTTLSKAWTEQLHHMGYCDMDAFVRSLAPSLKYPGMTITTFIASSFTVPLIKIFGLNDLAFLGLLITFALELLTGRWAAKARNEEIVSSKGIRFSFKVAFYLAIIFMSYQLAQSYSELDNSVGKVLFDYAHLFFVAEITYENWISIKENIGDVKGSDWLDRFKEKIKEKL